MIDEDDDSLSSMYKAMKEEKKKRQLEYQKNGVPKDKDLLRSLQPRVEVKKIEDDGSGGEKYVLDFLTERGTRTVDWWTSTGLWKVRKGRGEGRGIYKMARYFKLIGRFD